MKKISDFNSATEKYPVVYAGSASRPEYVDMPTILQQQEGVAPIDTLPAQWWNAMWKLATRDINAFRDYVGDSITEINNLLTKFGITLDDADSEQLYDFFHDDYVQNYLSSALHSFFVYKSGDTIDGDLHIKGDLSVDGIGEEIVSTELKVGANTITLRNENPSALGNTELAGIVTKNYDGNNHNNIIAINNNGEARTGDIDIATRILYSNNGINFYTDKNLTIPATIGANEEVRDTGNQTSGGVEIYEGITYSNNDTEPLLTRAEANSLVNGHILVWDATNKRAVDGGSIIDRIYPVGSIYQNKLNSTNPGTLFGIGTWVQITDKFLASRGSSYIGADGGHSTVTLDDGNLPAHTHFIGGNTGEASASFYVETHKADITAAIDHTHQVSAGYYEQSGSQIAMLKWIYKDTPDASLTTTGASATWATITDNGHSHTVNQTPHTHSLPQNTGSTGLNTPFDITPPYIGVYTWYRES